MGLILSNQQVDVIDNHSNQKDEGYDDRGVGHSFLFYDISFEVIHVQTKSSERKEIEVERSIYDIIQEWFVHPCSSNFFYYKEASNYDDCY